MGLDAAILGSLVTTAGGLLMQIISKVKCVYRHTAEGCEPACACMDGKLEKEQECLEVHTVEVNGVQMLYAARKQES